MLRSAAMAACLATAACGGGGGGVHSTPTPPRAPTPTPSPSPSPGPTPTPTGNDTAEYRATVGAVSMDALAAYNKGATGKGIKAAIFDSGLDKGSQEFGGRIDPASTDVAGNRTIDDEGGHGTAVAFTLAGRRNGTGTQGVAFDATLLILRGDTPGTCATNDDDGQPACSFTDTSIAKGVDIATANGARVINLSLGGDAASPELLAAIDRATKAGIIVVIAAGNDSKSNPDPFAQTANSPEANGLVIIAGSTGPGAGLSSFSDKAGNGAAHYLAAVGYHVRAPCEDTQVCLWDGTSFAAPQISGAIALLAQAFPNLSGSQIVQILFDSARDAGNAGTDAVYGRGILDLTKAFQPLGATSVAGSSAPVSLTHNATLSAPMGDAAQTGLGAVILDGFDRAFAIDLARTINSSGPTRDLVGALQSRQRGYSVDAGRTAVMVTIAPARDDTRIERTLLTTDDATRARAIAGIVTSRLGSDVQFAVGFSESGSTLTAQLAGRSDPAFLVARDPVQAQGFTSDIGSSAAVRQQFGRWGISVSAESGNVLSPGDSDLAQLRDRYRRFGYDRFAIGADRRFGALATSLTATRLDERDTVLGARFNDALGGSRAATWFLDAAAELDIGAGWSIGGSARQGWTSADVRGGLSGSGQIRTSAFAADLGKHGVFGQHDSFGLRVAQPLRVSTGGIDLDLPTYYDYDTLSVNSWTTQRLNLTPGGREIDIEARYALPLLGGDFQTNLFWRRDPGNFAALDDDLGMAMRYGVAF